jgi:hypothetical protein
MKDYEVVCIGLAVKYNTMLKLLAKDEHSSLFHPSGSDE